MNRRISKKTSSPNRRNKLVLLSLGALLLLGTLGFGERAAEAVGQGWARITGATRATSEPSGVVSRTPMVLLHSAAPRAPEVAKTGAVITVTTTNQEVDSDADCSLQEAIFAANYDASFARDPANLNGPYIPTACTPGSGADTIVLEAGAVYQVSGIIQNQFSIAGLVANPDIRSTITIQGNGARLERVGGLNLRAFVVNSAPGEVAEDDPKDPQANLPDANGNLTLQNLHIKGFIGQGGNGGPGGGGGMGAGGAIFVRKGTLTVDNCTFENNAAIGGNGAPNPTTAGGGGGGGIGGNGTGSASNGGGGGGGSRGKGGLGGNSGGGGGGTANDGVPGGAGVGGNGGFNCGGKGGDFNPQNVNGSNGFCTGGGAGGGAEGTGAGINGGPGGIGNYGGGGGGGGASSGSPTPGAGGAGGLGGGGGNAGTGPGAGGNGGFGGGGGGNGSSAAAGIGGAFGGIGAVRNGGGGAGLGGAIFNESGNVTIRNSTFFGNTATGGAAGGAGAGAGLAEGGAVFARNGSTKSYNSTFSNNAATGGNGGAIYIFGVLDGVNTTASFIIRNSIVANNGTNACLLDVGGLSVANAGSGNLIRDNAAGPQACPGVVKTTDPVLGPLALNIPGKTPTMAITSTSPAYDMADAAACLATDQRGVTRPQFLGCDIGAYELAPPFPADLVLFKTASAGPVVAGGVGAAGQITFTITAYNAGPDLAGEVEITDFIPANTTLVGAVVDGAPLAPPAPVGTATADFTCAVTNGKLVCRPTVGASLPPFAGVTITYTVQVGPSVAPGTLITNSANITTVGATPTVDQNPSNNTQGPTSTLVNALADLGITKSTSNPTPTAGGAAFAYTLVVTNNGPSDARNIVVNDPMPPGVIFQNVAVVNNPSIPGFGLICSGPPNATNGTVTCTGNLPGPNGMSISTSTITIVAQIVSNVAGGVRTNTATVASATQETSPNVFPNSASVQQNIVNDSSLSITKTGPPTEVCAGDNLNYDIAVRNSANSSAINVVVTDIIPANATFVSVTGVGEFAGNCTFNPATNTVACTASSLPPGTAHINLVVKTAAGTPTGPFTNNATLAAAVGVITGANPAQGTTTIIHCADLALKKTAPVILGAGTTIDYLLKLSNSGPSDITGGINPGVITIMDTLPVAAQVFVSATAGPGEAGAFTCTFDSNTRKVTCVNAAGVPGNFPVGAMTTIVIKVKISPSAVPGTNIENCGMISLPTPATLPQIDPNTSNNTSCASSVVGEVATVADLGVSKTATSVVDPDGAGPLAPVALPVVGPNVPPGSVNAGGYIRYDLPFGNAGPADAVNVRLTDVVPGNTAFVGALATGGVFVPAAQPPALPFTFTIQAVDTVAFPLLGPNINLTCTVSGSPGNQQIQCTPFGNTGLTPPYANGVLPEGYQGTLSFFVKVNESVQGGTIVSNPANITSAPGGSSLPTPDPNPGNNTSLATSTLVVTASNLSISKIVQSAVTAASNPNQTGPLGPATPPNGTASTGTTVLPGTLLTYRLTITNNGPSDVSNLRVTDILPSGLETPPGLVLGVKFVSATPGVPSGATFTCGPIAGIPFIANPAGNGGTLTCTAPSLSANAPNNTASIDITVFIDPATTNSLVNVATVDATLNNFNRPISGTTILTTPVPPRVGPVGDQQAASVLIFPVYTSDAASPHRENTRMSVTNISVRDSACVHLFNVEGATCSIADLFLCLTPNQTITFLASELDPGNRGYSMAVSVDCETGLPLGTNNLIGEEFVKFNSGHSANLAAWGVRGVTLPTAPLEPDGETAILKFDGIRYQKLPRIVSADNIGSTADGDSTMLIVDRIGGNMMESALPIGNLFGWLYNDIEIGYSFTARYTTCQLREILSSAFPRTTPGIGTVIPATHTGWLKFWSTQDGALIGSQITFNANANASSRAFNQGHNLHILSQTSSATLTIPVVIPFC